MKVAYLIMGHRDPDQILRLIDVLRDSGAFFVIHIDKRAAADVFAPLKDYAAAHPEVFLARRIRCYWGGFGIAQAMIECLQTAARSGRPFDYAILLSAQDYPIKSAAQIEDFLTKNEGAEFIESFSLAKPNRWTSHSGYFQAMNRVRYWTFFIRSRTFHLPIARKFPFGWEPYGGSQWWGLSRECILYLDQFLRRNRGFVRYFKHVLIPDESLFQSILSNSAFAGRIVNDDLRYIDWEHPNPKYPRTLESDDFDLLRASPKLFARKFDPDRSKELRARVDKELLGIQA
jgi:Core-2/I-Branching enzyme